MEINVPPLPGISQGTQPRVNYVHLSKRGCSCVQQAHITEWYFNQCAITKDTSMFVITICTI